MPESPDGEGASSEYAGSEAGSDARGRTDTPPLPAQLAHLRASSRPPSAPPSRPGTSMSNASSIDDLLGAPTGGKRPTLKNKKKTSRYIDVMAK
jgi:COPII coat assembly protein SEC16